MRDEKSLRLRGLGLLLILAALGLMVSPVRADAGPKPTMTFTFVWETETPLTIVEGELLQCEDPTCSDAKLLETLGPQGFRCTSVPGEMSCSSMAYGYDPYSRLRLTFSDGVTRESGVFEKSYFNARYEVTVRGDDLVVDEKIPIPTMIIGGSMSLIAIGILEVVLLVGLVLFIVVTREQPLAFRHARGLFIVTWVLGLLVVAAGAVATPTVILTVTVEAILISIYAAATRARWLPWFTLTLLGNMITLPLLVGGLFALEARMPYALLLGVSELGIWLVEAAVLHLPQRRSLPVLKAVGLSLILNLISLGIGLVIRI
jgi:hypothetical protein